jgi:cellulose synthase/poly-beta-1,6-N-acetylglucosamine synthase-like glycosyltransferase
MNDVATGSIVIAVLFWASLGGILYTYFGYPVLIFLLAKMIQKPETYRTHKPSVTLLIAAYDEETVIEDKIKNSLTIDYPKDLLQILVVTDGSRDRTPDIAKRYTSYGIEILHEPERRGKMAAINRALPNARGEIVVFSDANNYYQPDTILKLTQPFGNPSVGGVTGAKVIGQGDGNLGASEGLYWKYESFIKKQESRAGSCTSAAGEVLAIRKNLYSPPPDHVINDDFYIAMQIVRSGYRLLYVPDAKSIERVSPSAQDEIARRTRINAGRFQAIAMAKQILPFTHPLLVWQILSHKFLRPIVPFFMIGAALFNLMAVFFPPATKGFWILSQPHSLFFLGLQILFYTLAWMGRKAGNRGEQNKLVRLFYIPTFLTNSNYAALMGFFRFLRGNQSHMWERIQRRG